MNEENIKKCWVINTCLMMGGFYPMWPRKVEPSLQIRKQKQNLIANQKKCFFFSVLTQDMLVDRLNRVKVTSFL